MAKVLNFKDGNKDRPGSVTAEETGVTPTAKRTPAQAIAQLDEAAAALFAAHNYLATEVDPSQAVKVKEFIARYGVLQPKVFALADKLKSIEQLSSKMLAELDTTLGEVLTYLQEAEAVARAHPRQNQLKGTAPTAAAAPATLKAMGPALVMGGLVILVAGGGFMLWKKQQEVEKAASKQSRKFSRAIAKR